MTKENREIHHLNRYSFTDAERKTLIDNDQKRLELSQSALAEDKIRNKFTNNRQMVILYLIFMERIARSEFRACATTIRPLRFWRTLAAAVWGPNETTCSPPGAAAPVTML
jgi:hypothetical protein